MAVLYVPWRRSYTCLLWNRHTCFSILLGSALAYVWPSTRLKEEIPEASKNLKWCWFKCLSSFSISLFNIIRSYKFCLLRRHVFLISLATTVLVAVTAHPGADMNRWLTNPVFTWIGKTELWHLLVSIPHHDFFMRPKLRPYRTMFFYIHWLK